MVAPRKTPQRMTAKQQQAKRDAKAGGYIDKNLDGVVDVDPLSREEMAAQYQSALGLIYSVPEITDIFDKAVKQQWVGADGQAKFNAAVQNSNWYRTNNSYFRTAWASEHFGMKDGQPSADWQTSVDAAHQAVQNRANQIGSDLSPEEVNALSRRYLYEGWGEQGRGNLLDQALSEEITYLPDGRGVASMKGSSGNLYDDLKAVATANGMNYSDNYYLSAAKSVASQLTTTDDWLRDIREQAAGMFPVYADKISKGVNVSDLASNYVNTMAQELEIDPNTISLNDPYIRSALTGNDQNGAPVAMSLWDFQRKLRDDPRWMNTNKAQNDVTSAAGKIMQMFGLMGRG